MNFSLMQVMMSNETIFRFTPKLNMHKNINLDQLTLSSEKLTCNLFFKMPVSEVLGGYRYTVSLRIENVLICFNIS